MNFNYRQLLDSYARTGTCSGYEELYEQLFSYGRKNWKPLQRAFDTTGINSFCDFICTYSFEAIEEVTKENRHGKGLTEIERLQCHVYCIGISHMYHNWILDGYDLTAKETAHALYDMMPRTVHEYWWKK